MRLHRLIVLISLALTSPASASDWWFVGSGGAHPNRTSVYVDAESARRNEQGVVRAWVYSYSETPLGNGERSARALNAFDCSSRTISLVSRITYDRAGAVIPAASVAEGSIIPVAPDTVGQRTLSFVCGEADAIEGGNLDPAVHAAALFKSTARAVAKPPAQKQARNSTGTGFFVGPNGHILTSFHVIKNARRIRIRTAAGEWLPAKVERVSAATDLAVLRVAERPNHFLTLAPGGSLTEGDRVFTIGFPASRLLGIEPRFTEGAVSALSGIKGENAWVQITVPIQPGNSGGPLVTEQGLVVGVIAATVAVAPFYRSTGTLPQGVNWAVKAEYAAPLLESPPAEIAASREEAIALTKNAITFIVADR